MHEGQTDLAVLHINADHAHLDFLAREQQVLSLGAAVVRQLRDVQQSLEALLELHKHSEVGDLSHVTREEVAHVVATRDLLMPRVGAQLLAAQGDTLLLLVHREDHTLHLVAFLDHLGGVADLLGPAHIRNVQETVNPLFDFNEGAVGRQVTHGA